MWAEVTLGLFTFFNAIRIFAYLPQIYKSYRDEHGATAVSCTTWGMFLLSHMTTAAYAWVNLNDLHMTVIFLINAAACAALVTVTFWQRLRVTLQQHEPEAHDNVNVREEREQDRPPRRRRRRVRSRLASEPAPDAMPALPAPPIRRVGLAAPAPEVGRLWLRLLPGMGGTGQEAA
jgi:hypothetical protein